MDDFFTLASFATLTGSVFTVVIVINVMRHAFGWGPRWVALVLSIAIAFLALHLTAGAGDQSKTADLGLLRYALAFINGCLIYTSAFGIQNAVIAPTTEMNRNFKSGLRAGRAPKAAPQNGISAPNDAPRVPVPGAAAHVQHVTAASPW